MKNKGKRSIDQKAYKKVLKNILEMKRWIKSEFDTAPNPKIWLIRKNTSSCIQDL